MRACSRAVQCDKAKCAGCQCAGVPQQSSIHVLSSLMYYSKRGLHLCFGCRMLQTFVPTSCVSAASQHMVWHLANSPCGMSGDARMLVSMYVTACMLEMFSGLAHSTFLAPHVASFLNLPPFLALRIHGWHVHPVPFHPRELFLKHALHYNFCLSCSLRNRHLPWVVFS